MLKQNKGITLVALVITIIVLLILAGVSISLVVGDNGVLTRATDSSNATKLGQMKEALGLAIEDCQTAYFDAFRTDATKGIKSYITEEKLAKALENQGYYLWEGSSKVAASATGETALTENGTYYIATNSADPMGDHVAFKLVYTTVGAKVNYATALNNDTVTVVATN